MQCIVTYATVCIGSYLQSVLRDKFLGLDAYHLPTACLCEQGSEDPWLFFEAKRSPRKKKVWATLVYPDRFKCSTDIMLYRTQACVAPCAGDLQLMLMHFIQLTVWHHTGMEDIAH
jgi:hypothetical protein